MQTFNIYSILFLIFKFINLKMTKFAINLNGASIIKYKTDPHKQDTPISPRIA